MKTMHFEIDDDELCTTPCPVYDDVAFRHPMHGVMIGSVTCQACAFNNFHEYSIENRIIICRALEEDK